jgi:hypothetical protein
VPLALRPVNRSVGPRDRSVGEMLQNASGSP